MKKYLLLLLSVVLLAASCTENERARSFGGTQEITLTSGKRVVNVTWKETDLWVLTKEDTTTKPSIYHFVEKSTYGVWNGEIIIKEVK